MPSSQRPRPNRQNTTPAPNGNGEAAARPPEQEPKLQLERVGDMLRRAREARGDDLQQIADYLCIRRDFLTALENSQYDQLPADAYVIGFLRSYASYLGLEGKDAIDRYRNEMAGRRKKPVLTIPTPIAEGRTPSTVILVGTAVAALLVYALWYGLSSSDRTAVNAPPPLPPVAASTDAATAPETPTANGTGAPSAPAAATTAAVPAPASSAPSPAAAPDAPSATPSAQTNAANEEATAPAPTSILPEQQAPAAPPAVAPPATAPAPAAANTVMPGPGGQVYGETNRDSHLTIRAEQASWILILDSTGNTVFDHVLKPGDVYRVPDMEGLVMTTGNGNGIILTLDGVDLPKLSTGHSHVLRNVSLSTEHLKALAVGAPE